MINLDEVTITRSGKNVFQNFSFQLNKGDNLVVSGENGSGKTTLLEVLSGKLHPKSGRVIYDFIEGGDDWDSIFKKRNEYLHYIPAQALYNVLGYAPDLHYQQRYYGTDHGGERVRGFLGSLTERLAKLKLPTEFDITSILDVELTKLSNGQIRKIIILRQLLRQVPKIILFDYPFEGLDAESRDALAAFIDHLHAELQIQFVITGHGDHLPTCMNRRVMLKEFKIIADTAFSVPRRKSAPIPSRQPHRSVGVTEPVVEFRDVAIRYGEFTLLDHFNWRVERGERWALTGRNGSGKTTLFSLIYADHPFAYSQTVFLFGRRRGTGESIWDVKKRIGYLGPELIHLMNGSHRGAFTRDYILSMAGTGMESELERLARFFKIQDLLPRPMQTLSSGQLQLMQLIIFFLNQKELLLLDEPFQFLDPACKKMVSNYLTSHLDPDTTLILITHDEDDVREWTEHRLHLQSKRSTDVDEFR